MSRVIRLAELIVFFDSHKLDEEPFRLNAGSVITNKSKFVASHIEYLKSNSGNTTFRPYYDRLIQLYNHEKNKGTV